MSDGQLIAAGLGCLMLPMLALLPVSLVLPYSSALDRLEFFVYFGGLGALVPLLPVLLVARLGNSKGVNGWCVTIAGGAAMGALVGHLLWTDRGFALSLTAMGAVYGLGFWAIAHGLAAYAQRRRGR